MKKLITLSLYIIIFSSIPFISCVHKLSKGNYKGIELISVTSDNRYWPGVFNTDTNFDTANRQWYHDVTISVKGNTVRVIKVPFYIKDGIKYLSKTDGGFYYYSGDVSFDNDDKTFSIFTSLDSCKFCPKLATAVPLYSYESYFIKKDRRKWIVNTDYEKNLTFEKQ